MAQEQIIIEPAKNWKLVDWQELRRYRDLFYFLIDRDVKVLYKQTILGFGWAIIRPVVSMIIFTSSSATSPRLAVMVCPMPSSILRLWCRGSTSPVPCERGRAQPG